MNLRRKNHEPITADLMKSWSKLDTDTGCWDWLKARFNSGYGHINYLGKGYNSQRLMFILSFPDISVEGMDVCHSCDNPACINPAHLFVATHHLNMMDMKKKGRAGIAERTRIIKPEPNGNWTKGTDHHDAKLDPDKVREIRRLLEAGYGCRKLGDMFGVNRTTIRGVAQKRFWKHVK